MESLINYAFRLAFALAAAGMLIPATRYMAKEAAKAYQHDFISLGQLSRTLNGDIPKGLVIKEKHFTKSTKYSIR